MPRRRYAATPDEMQAPLPVHHGTRRDQRPRSQLTPCEAVESRGSQAVRDGGGTVYKRLLVGAAFSNMAVGCSQSPGSIPDNQSAQDFENASVPRRITGPLHTSGRSFVTADGHDVR